MALKGRLIRRQKLTKDVKTATGKVRWYIIPHDLELRSGGILYIPLASFPGSCVGGAWERG